MESASSSAVWWSVAARGVTLRGTRAGPSDGSSAVLAIHGGPGIDGAGLRHVLAPLAEQAELVVPDLRGHGRSDLATAASWTLDDWADDLAEVTDQLRLHRPVVVGVSFGGWVALRLASRHPEHVGALVVAATSARLPNLDEGAERMTRLGGPASGAAWRAAHEQGFVADEHFERHVQSLMSVRQPNAGLRDLRATQIRTPQVNEHFTPQFELLDLTADAAAVQCPVTVVVGERDPLTTPELAQATAASCQGPARLRLIPGTAHDLLVDAPDALIEEIRRAQAARDSLDQQTDVVRPGP